MRINILSCVILNIVKTPFTILLNCFVLMILYQNQDDIITSKALSINLVIADLLMGSFTSPFAATEFMMIYLKKDPCILANISVPISFTIGSISFTTLAVLAMDYYIKFWYPFKHQKLQNRAIVIPVIAIIWVMPAYPVLYSAINKDMTTLDKYILVTGATIIIINVYCYIMIYRLIRKHRRSIRAEAHRLGINATQSKDTTVAFCGILLFISMCFCFLPITVLSGLSAATNRQNKRFIGYFTYWAWTLAALNSLINPILKFYRLASVRAALKDFWQKKFKKASNVETVRSISAQR